MPEPWLLNQGGVHIQMKRLVLKLVMAQETPPLKGQVCNGCWHHDEKDKRNIFVFIKRKDKGYRYEDKIGSKKIWDK